MHMEEFVLEFFLKFQLWICIFETIQPGFLLQTEKWNNLIWFLTSQTRPTTKEEEKKKQKGVTYMEKHGRKYYKISSRCLGEKWTHAIGIKFIGYCRVFASLKWVFSLYCFTYSLLGMNI